LQAAVPKSQKLQLQAISNAELGGGQEAQQQMRVTSVQGVSSDPVSVFIHMVYINLSFSLASSTQTPSAPATYLRQRRRRAYHRAD
jgi:hypothetical protein